MFDDFNWAWSSRTFDFIHMRQLAGCVLDWAKLYKEAFEYESLLLLLLYTSLMMLRQLKPGGWVEHVELSLRPMSVDDTLRENSPLGRLWNHLKKYGAEKDKTFEPWGKHRLEGAGFINATSDTKKVPIGSWAEGDVHREWGALNEAYLLAGLEGFALRPLTSLGVHTTIQSKSVVLTNYRIDIG